MYAISIFHLDQLDVVRYFEIQNVESCNIDSKKKYAIQNLYLYFIILIYEIMLISNLENIA